MTLPGKAFEGQSSVLWRALSLFQPWATMVALGRKRIETRSWVTHFRGPFLLHASQGVDATWRADFKKGVQISCRLDEIDTQLDAWRGALHAKAEYPAHYVEDVRGLQARRAIFAALRSEGVASLADLPRGALLAWSHVEACNPTGYLTGSGRVKVDPPLDAPRDHEFYFGDYTEGRSGFVLSAPAPLSTPVPCKGARGFWVVPKEVESKVVSSGGLTVYPAAPAQGRFTF